MFKVLGKKKRGGIVTDLSKKKKKEGHPINNIAGFMK